jgi:hypothetical protein
MAGGQQIRTYKFWAATALQTLTQLCLGCPFHHPENRPD